MIMKHISIAIIFLAALLFSACSQDDMPDNRTVSIVATIDHGMSSRAETGPTDDLPARAVLWYKKSSDSPQYFNVWTKIESTELNGNAFSFNIELDKTETYDIVVWADDGDNNMQNSGSMVPYNIRQSHSSIAFSGRVTGLKPSDTQVSVTLKHVVAKIMVNETGSLDEKDVVKLDFNHLQYSYDALKDNYIKSANDYTPVNLSKEITAETAKSGTLLTFYYLAPPAEHKDAVVQDVKLTYVHHAKGDRVCEKTITNVPIHANRRTVISGSFKSIDPYADIDFSVATDDNWEDGGNVKFPLSFTIGEDGDLASFLSSRIGSTQGLTLPVYGEVTSDEFQALKNFMLANSIGGDARMTLDFSNATFPDNTMPANAFDGGYYSENPLTGLKAIILPAKVSKIGDGAFRGCKNLESINLAGIKNIGYFAFQECDKLTSIDLTNCNYVGESAFHSCSLLESIIWPVVESRLVGRTFGGAKKLSGDLFLGDNITIGGGDSPFGWSEITSINIKAPIDGTAVFNSMYNVTKIVIRGEKVNFGTLTFQNCYELKELDLSESTELPEFKSTVDKVFKGITSKIENITVYVKDADMKAQFESDTNWQAAGFSADQFVVRQ